MKPVFLTLCFIISVKLTTAQGRYTIYYAFGNPPLDTKKSQTPFMKSVLVVRDSIAYYYHIFPGEKRTPKLPLGSRFRGHSSYINLSNRKILFQSKPMGLPKYLVEDTLKIISWKIENETKFIAGYECKMATAMVNNRNTTVFFTEELPASLGPVFYGGLPGTILEMLTEGVSNIFTAIEVLNEAVEIVEPKKGKRISREKFDKELKEMNPSGSQRIILRIQ